MARRYTLPQRVFIVKCAIQTSLNMKQIKKMYKDKYKVKKSPSSNQIRNLYKKFEVEATLHDRKTTRTKTVRTQENIDLVENIIKISPSKSIRRVSSETGLCSSTVQKILREDLTMFPYKVQLIQGLVDSDPQSRLDFCKWFISTYTIDPTFLDNIFFSDEAHFNLSGSVNRQNCRFWGTENPHEVQETKKFSPHVTCWVAISRSRIIGPYFFENEESAVTVNAVRYQDMLRTWFFPQLRTLGYNLNTLYFQHDGATAHTANTTLALLRSTFHEDRVISKDLWPPRSPDLTPPDFFFVWLPQE